MGIGISYTGHDGRTRKFDSGEDARSFLDRLAPASRKQAADGLQSALARAGQSPLVGGGAPRLMTGGSVVNGNGGICLRGEEYSPLVEGVKMFASVNGSKGFKTIDEIDPSGAADVCGPMFGCNSDDEDTSTMTGGSPVRIPFVSRTRLVKEETSSQIVVYEFIREMVFSKSGRLVGCSQERRRVVGSFVPGEDGENVGEHKYCVRLFASGGGDAEHPVPRALAFGTQDDLDTYDEGSDSFACNENAKDPPVKIVGVTACGAQPG